MDRKVYIIFKRKDYMGNNVNTIERRNKKRCLENLRR